MDFCVPEFRQLLFPVFVVVVLFKIPYLEEVVISKMMINFGNKLFMAIYKLLHFW